jgi:cyclopropane fatty-acyl-phospholipid synthase-like methyltransferase
MSAAMLPFSAACERNKDPILGVLRAAFADRAEVLEIGSGTGQHAQYFAEQLTHLTWHPTEQLAYLQDLTARVKRAQIRNLRPPTLLDVRQSVWPLRSVDAVFTANTLHIMSWPEVQSLFRGVGQVLAPGGMLSVYGAFRYEGRYTSDSNQNFDLTLKARDPASGLRDIEAVTALAAQYGMSLRADHDLPAFNRLLLFAKEPA